MLQKIFTIFLIALSVTTVSANDIKNLRVELRNDTLYVVPNDSTSTLPKNIVIVGADTKNIYQRIFNDETDDLMENHPANDLYNNIWSSDHVNPYKIPIDSIPDSAHIDCSKFCIPVPGYITSKFGPRRYRYHFGTDLKLNIGDTIHCAFDGKVRLINYDANGYGHYAVVRHDNGLETVYAHMSRVLVHENQRVLCGEPIGLGGSTGRSTGPHLHFETRYLGNAINPELLFNFEAGSMRTSDYLITKRNSFYHQKAVQAMHAAKYYTVRQGDTLGAIARRNSTTVSNLCKLNRIRQTSIIRPGQRLRVR